MRPGPRWLLLLAVPGLAGCGLLTGVFDDGIVFGGTRQVEFRVSEKLNGDSPVPVELIVVYEEGLEGELAKLPAGGDEGWFALRDQYRRDFSSEDFESWKWEWTPGQSVEPQTFSYRPGALSAILFADYEAPGEHRARVEPPNQDLQVLLRSDHFLVRPRP